LFIRCETAKLKIKAGIPATSVNAYEGVASSGKEDLADMSQKY
jgi:hypothetical protein